ncbi:hypothetical protein Ae201684_013025 [Aphanomyces euteiches]|uniref:Uncharacterized protein n=1 Tax=Aphanomyces euteiches TaxID=100861 RepID=A0A6G0WPE8_9STRA|nr:hypothetical protein Ae201684_013025 [Aphanomyces euteiches]
MAAAQGVHDLLDMNDVLDDGMDAKDDIVLMQDSDTICQTLHQICQLEQDKQGILDWIKEEDGMEVRQAEVCEPVRPTGVPVAVAQEEDTNKAVEDALYCEDEDDDDEMRGAGVDIKMEDATLQPLTDALLTENILDMFTSMYADDQQQNQIKMNALSIQIPTPITIPRYQPLQPPTVTYQSTRLLAPHSTPNMHFANYFSQPTQSPSKPFPGGGLPPPYPGALFSPTHQNLASIKSSCPKSKTPKALPRFTLSPDIAEQKLMQIFFRYCDPATKCLGLTPLLNMLTKHRIKEDTPLNLAILFPPNETTTKQFPHSLFESDKDTLTLQAFQNAFQICNRCTEMKRKQSHHKLLQSDNDDDNDIAPVLVRVVPATYEGPKIKSCDHFQWTWCEGFEKTGNEKCNGTNRHDKCPKYLANCTLWKHRLPPKNRKSKGPHDMDSPAKKLKFFS